MRFRALAIAVLVALAGCGPRDDSQSARPDDSRFAKTVIAPDLAEPVDFAFLPNGEVLVAQRRGELVIAGPEGPRSAGMAPGIHAHEEFGLYAVAVAPDFKKTAHIYLSRTVGSPAAGLRHRTARFSLRDGRLDPASEVVVIEFPIDDTCCHTGGGLVFDDRGALYIATGDNTNPFRSDGYAPIDFRSDAADRAFGDALRGAGDTMDLRGKILRVLPKAAGGYDNPDGNLFPHGEGGRPEIYAMGFRNPYTLVWDRESRALFVGDIGPDADADHPDRGPRGHDEINRITAPGNFGWPLFIGENLPYRAWDFAELRAGAPFDPAAPVNGSPRNEGARVLPPAQPALIAYPYGPSERFPSLGAGGRNALAGGIYRMPPRRTAPMRFPAYFDGKLFISDFVRGWLQVATLDAEGRVTSLERLAPQLSFAAPIELKFGPDGALYVLEYGPVWFSPSPQAALSRVDYLGEGNRAPSAQIALSAESGAVPLAVTASAERSSDPDGDALTARWVVRRLESADSLGAAVAPIGEGEQVRTGLKAAFEIAEPGLYAVVLEVEDEAGSIARAQTRLIAGNTAPRIEIGLTGNGSFFWPEGPRTIDYAVTVVDAEDGAAAQAPLRVQFEGTPPALGDPLSLAQVGEAGAARFGCLSCHQVEAASAGPSYRAVAERYAVRANALDYLAEKIARGGAGAFGDVAMPAHGHLSRPDRLALAAYVLSLAPRGRPVGAQGQARLSEHRGAVRRTAIGELPQGVYVLRAGYEDRGALAAPALASQASRVLKPSRVLASDAYLSSAPPEGFGSYTEKDVPIIYRTFQAGVSAPGLLIGRFDLSEIRAITFGSQPYEGDARWRVEIRLDRPDAAPVASGEFEVAAAEANRYRRDRLVLSEAVDGERDVYMAATLIRGGERILYFVDAAFERR